MRFRSPLVVIDTNVLFEGLTTKGTASSFIIEAWLAEELRVAVCEALAWEYVDVLSRKLSAQRWRQVEPLLHALLSRSEFVIIRYSWRPSSPDPADEHVIDCVQNANALLVTWNTAHFRMARRSLGMKVLTPPEFIAWWSAVDHVAE